MALQSDEEKVFSGSWDDTIRSWSIMTGENLRIYKGHSKGIFLTEKKKEK